ncbi:MAG: hypothetical protein Fur002_01080 [Anaerolineales bacterium]
MKHKTLLLVIAALLMVLAVRGVAALPRNGGVISTPEQLINEVNALRLSRGLNALEVHSALMQSAQSQANYMASTGYVTHERPGTTYTQQLLALGFPLSGDLSLGGFRSENILGSGSPLVWNGIPSAWQDELHMNTMLSVNYTHIGAGIAQSGGMYYYAVDAAAATNSGQMQSQAAEILTSLPPDSNAAGVSQYIVPVEVSAAQPNGEVYHVVQYGQTLWAIAIAYDTKIKEIQALNNLGESIVVQQGQKLLVKRNATPPPPPSPTATIFVTTTPALLTVTPLSAPPTPTRAAPQTVTAQPPAKDEPAPSAASNQIFIAFLIAAALIGGGMAVWLIRDPD